MDVQEYNLGVVLGAIVSGKTHLSVELGKLKVKKRRKDN